METSLTKTKYIQIEVFLSAHRNSEVHEKSLEVLFICKAVIDVKQYSKIICMQERMTVIISVGLSGKRDNSVYLVESVNTFVCMRQRRDSLLIFDNCDAICQSKCQWVHLHT